MLLCSFDENYEIRLLEFRHGKDLLGLAKNLEFKPQTNEWIFYTDPKQPEESAKQHIKGGLEKIAQGKGLIAGIWCHEEMVGVIELDIVYPNIENSTATLDYFLSTDYRGKGIMTKACKAMTDYAFCELKINRMELRIDTKNVKSCGIPDRLGFKKDGVLRQRVPYGDFFGDLAVYSILRSEWEQ
ncbi:GNAT family N-acetyltransferase [Planctomycetota bacterium]